MKSILSILAILLVFVSKPQVPSIKVSNLDKEVEILKFGLTIDTLKQYNYKHVDSTIHEIANSRIFYSSPHIKNWYSLDLVNDLETKVNKVIYLDDTYTEEVIFHVFTNKQWSIYKDGLVIPINKRKYKKRVPVYKFTISPGDTAKIRISTVSAYIGQMGLYIDNEQEFSNWELQHTILYALILGIAFTIISYHIFLFISLKDVTYLFYLLHEMCFAIYVLNFSGFILYFSPSVDSYYNLYACIAPATAFLILFSNHLLDIKSFSKKLYTYLNYTAYLFFILFICILLDITLYNWALYSIILVMILLFFVGIFSIKHNRGQGILYTIAITPYQIGVIAVCLFTSGIKEYSFFENNLMLFGSVFQMIMFSLTLAYKMRLLEKSKKNAQEELIREQKLRESILEKEVNNRTKELNATKNDLMIQRDELSIRNEKIEILIKEVHHRVKNNFQIMSSLLELVMKEIEDKRAIEKIEEGISRINSMALVHQKLYSQENFSIIKFDDYALELSKKILSLYNLVDVKINIKSQNEVIDIDTAIPIGLILNEFLTNSCKYAFKQKEKKISIKLSKEKNNFKLMYSDFGKTQIDFDNQVKKGIGINLIQRLSRQLYGVFNYKFDGYSTFEVEFKNIDQRKRIE